MFDDLTRDRAALPAPVLRAIEARTGPVVRTIPALVGDQADVAATLVTAEGKVFVKAAPIRRAAVRGLRREALLAPRLTGLAPRLRWTLEGEGWLVLGWEHIEGRHADYGPGSADLEILAALLGALASTPCPSELRRTIRPPWLATARDPSPARLLHADLNSTNVLITKSGRAYLVDWANAARGPAWMETALLPPWLLRAGHTPASAEGWLSQIPAWRHAEPEILDTFAVTLAARWQARSVNSGAPWIAERADLSLRWADHRLTRRPPTLAPGVPNAR
ncbi:phosphotransferase [Bailinhaonella thermotolerans]|uniref:Aminoglycoside phosphotransferase n=1 Tax=Bailinhaonella thermotolerans TaxID=1070861 RepID=A0A3A3ZZJ1_9ACTN|nr:phosphotransferase [Bailinhaonella thermotolerans]RJL21203.1 aminoglycoside phosphotransferase [Bailinhaonella thermotolerans]